MKTKTIVFALLVSGLIMSATSDGADQSALQKEILATSRKALENRDRFQNFPTREKLETEYRESLRIARATATKNEAHLEAAVSVLRNSSDWKFIMFMAAYVTSGLQDANLVHRATALLGDESPKVRLAAVYMVSPFSEHRHILFREDGGIRSRVDTAWSTGGRGKNFAIKNEQLRRTLLNRLREEKDLAVQGALVWSLTYSQREDAQITELFFKKIEATENVELRRLLVDSLALGASGMDICENLLSYLKAFKDPIGRWEIIRHLASVEVRTELSTQQKEKVVEALMTVLETDSEESLREAAALGLKNFFPSRQSIPANVVSELAGIANLEKSEKVIARINELLQIEPKR